MSAAADRAPGAAAAERLVWGVDGGGTQTTAWLASIERTHAPVVIGTGKASSSNPRAVGMPAAQQALRDALAAAWRAAQLAPRPVEAAVLAIAGTGSEPLRSEMRHWLEAQSWAARVALVHDAEAVLAAGVDDGSGVALIAGTGSSAVAIDSQGRRATVGGWGWRWGDEGSAYWIGLEALRAASHADDGRGPATELTAELCRVLGVEQPRLLLAAVEHRGDVRRAIADLAPAVAAAARGGDGVSLEILQRAGEELARLVQAALQRLAWSGPFPLVVAGGVATNVEPVRTALTAALATAGLAADPLVVAHDPAWGCVRLAQRMADD